MSYKNSFALGLICALNAFGAPARSHALKAFTVADNIALAKFTTTLTINGSPIVVSPSGRFVAVWAERGLLKNNLVEDEVRVYAMAALRDFVAHAGQSQVPAPVMDLLESTYKEGPIISNMRWLPNSTGLTFLIKSANGDNQLALMRMQDVRPLILSLKGQDVLGFDVRDATHYAYTVQAPGSESPPGNGQQWVAWDGTGQSLISLAFPGGTWQRSLGDYINRSVLWAAVGGKPTLVRSRETDSPIVMYASSYTSSLALSPDGSILAASVPVQRIPNNWKGKFPSLFHNTYQIHAGYQNLNSSFGSSYVTKYVLIDLRSGRKRWPRKFRHGYKWISARA